MRRTWRRMRRPRRITARLSLYGRRDVFGAPDGHTLGTRGHSRRRYLTRIALAQARKERELSERWSRGPTFRPTADPWIPLWTGQGGFEPPTSGFGDQRFCRFFSFNKPNRTAAGKSVGKSAETQPLSDAPRPPSPNWLLLAAAHDQPDPLSVAEGDDYHSPLGATTNKA
jgi:hypothetical protein